MPRFMRPLRLLPALVVLFAACSDDRVPRGVPGDTTADASAGSVDAFGAPGDAGQSDAGASSDAASTPDLGQALTDAAAAPDSGDDGRCHYGTSVSGLICSPDAREWVAGAVVSVDAVDCDGAPVTLSTTSAQNGWFELVDVPPGNWTLTAVAGAFSRTYPITIVAGEALWIPGGQICVRQEAVEVAVVTGAGDEIEVLLDDLGIEYDLYDGETLWATEAAPFLSDLTALESYDLVFIDCAAAAEDYTVDLGASSSTIVQNLAQYVQNGGSLYASDWALTFLAMAFPSSLSPDLRNVASVTSPFTTTELAGYAPQTITANVVDTPLAAAIGTSQVSITFPDSPGARSTNWGLLDGSNTSATVLVEGRVATCDAAAVVCDQDTTPGPEVTTPLAVRFKLTPPSDRGGNVYYTAFHNIAQTGPEVRDILRWIVFHL